MLLHRQTLERASHPTQCFAGDGNLRLGFQRHAREKGKRFDIIAPHEIQRVKQQRGLDAIQPTKPHRLVEVSLRYPW